MNHLLAILDAAVASPMDVLGLVLLAVLALILWRAQRGPGKVDLTYLLVDSAVGNVTLAKFAGFGAFLASTWVLVDLAVTGKWDSTYGIGYIAIWAGAKVATDYALMRGNQSTTTTP